MPRQFCKPVVAITRLTLEPLRFVASRYRERVERKRLERDAVEARRAIDDRLQRELQTFHEQLWDRWPEAVSKVREHVTKEVNDAEHKSR